MFEKLIFLLWLTSLVLGSVVESGCSREVTRDVRFFIKHVSNKILPEIDKDGFELSQDCPLNLERDMYLEQEKAKIQESSSKWTCSYCGKSFRSEFYLDRHLDAVHSHSLPSNAVCLADYCHALGCRRIDPVHCNSVLTSQWQTMCNSVMHKCFPPEKGFSSRALFGKMTEQFCKPISCETNAMIETPEAKDANESQELLRNAALVCCVTVVIAGYGAIYMLHSENRVGSRTFEGLRSPRRRTWLGKLMSRRETKEKLL